MNFKLAIPAMIFAVAGASVGANISLRVDDQVFMMMLVIMLPVVAFVVLNKKIFHDGGDDASDFSVRKVIIATAAAFLIGMYDGFYGPGTGTFLIIAFTVFAKLDIRSANAQAKVINLTTNITSLTIFLLNGQVVFLLGLAAAACNMAGNYVGAGLAMRGGGKITRPVILLVLALLFLKILGLI